MIRATGIKKITPNYLLKWKVIFPLVTLLMKMADPLEGANPYIPLETNRQSINSINDTVQVTVDDLSPAIPINNNIFGGFVTARLRGAYIWDSDLGHDDKLNEYGIRSVRLFGCKSELYHWRDMVGPVDERKMWKHVSVCFGNDVRQLYDATNSPSLSDLTWGPDEFLGFFISRGVVPILTVNFGTGNAQEAANFVEYVNDVSPDPDCDGADGDMPNEWTPESFAGDEAAPDGYFACLRHYYGSEEPYGVHYWEVGNELHQGGGSGVEWATGDLYYTGGTTIISPGFTTRNPDGYDWSGENRQTTGAPGERFYVMFPPIAPPSDGALQLQFVESFQFCGDEEESACRWEPTGNIITGWQEGSLAQAGPQDQVFEINRSEGYIQFGDGINGMIPPYNDQADLGYEVILSYPSGPHDGFEDFANAMKAVDPTIKVGSAFAHFDDNGDIAVPFPDESQSMDFIVWHPYVPIGNPNVAPDLDDFRATVMAWSHSLLVEGLTEALRSELGNDMEFAWTEWNLGHSFAGTPPNSIYVTSLDVGLFVADMLRQMIVDRVSISNFFVLNGWAGPVRAQGSGLFTMNSTFWPPDGLVITTAQPGALVLKMFNDYFGPVALPTMVTNSQEFTACWPNCPDSETNYPVIEALASKHSDGRLAVLIINKNVSLDIEVAITIASNTHRDGIVDWAILNSADPTVHPGEVTNSIDDPEAVSVTASQLSFANPLQLTIPAHTVSMVVLPADTTTGLSISPTGLPKKFELHQNYPNPFNPVTTIEYQISHSNHVKLIIYNVLGQEVKMLVDRNQVAGSYSTIWDGKDDLGKDISSGIYFYQLSVKEEHFKKTNKLLLLR